MKSLVERLLDRVDLTRDEAGELLAWLVSDDVSAELKAAALTALRAKGETSDELAGIAHAMRERALAVGAPRDLPLVDTCGTGGDGKATINVSTAAALVVAATGRARVAKHGNRSVSSRSGSADVLEQLGVAIAGTPASAASALGEHGFAFLFAPGFHPAMAKLAPVRRAMGLRTVINLCGPLTNPARPDRQIIGVYDEPAARKMAQAMVHLGIERGLVVTGLGFDEATPCGPFLALRVTAEGVRESSIDPADLGFERCAPEALAGGSPEENAALLVAVLAGARGPQRDAVVLNAALALELCDLAFDEARALAEEAIDAGRATALLRALGGRA